MHVVDVRGRFPAALPFAPAASPVAYLAFPPFAEAVSAAAHDGEPDHSQSQAGRCILPLAL